MKKRTFVIHGWEGYPEEGWRPWFKSELEKRGFRVLVPAMPDTMHPKMKAWVDYLAKIVGSPDENSFFVGHSLGCIVILRYLETLKESQKIGGAIFVAGFAGNLGEGFEELSSFFGTPVDWKRIKEVCDKFVIIHSDDDQWVPLKFGEELAKSLKTNITKVHGMKHFSGDDGITKAPIILEKLLEIAK
jgi:hypothetical protein